jgi:hypothetical protein
VQADFTRRLPPGQTASAKITVHSGVVALMIPAVEKIARLVGRIGTATTETVYRHQIRPVVTGGAEVMDQLFPRRDGDAELLTHERS